MCGIFGYLQKESKQRLDINTENFLNHRGPDDTGWILFNGKEVTTGKSKTPDSPFKLFFLHKRLSILDLNSSAKQPMACEQNRFFLIFNGEIYNYLELRQELSALDMRFYTNSDSEVLLNAFIAWGEMCLTKLIGMFAFAIFDSLSQRVFMARDSFGIKPFYYYQDSCRFLFCSEMNPLLSFLPKQRVNSDRLFYYLNSGMSDFEDQTILSSISALPAGHYLEIDLTTLQLTKHGNYWRPDISKKIDISFNEAASQIRLLFLESIDLHLRSDVTLGATLSGGIDSSSIVSCMRHLYPSREIKTFSYIASNQQLSEEKWVDLVNIEVNAISHKVYEDNSNLVPELQKLIGLQDEPFGSTSIYAQYKVFDAIAAAGIKVVLDGQGADEILGGYHFYFIYRLIALLKNFQVIKALKFLVNNRQLLRHRSLALACYLLFPKSLRGHVSALFENYLVPSWLNANWFKNCLNDMPSIAKYKSETLHQELAMNLSFSSLPKLLRYQDRNSMVHSIESRVPFLTTKLVDFVYSLPENFLISNTGETKAVFREAMRGIVPSPILDRRDKIGFATPEKSWLTAISPWIEEQLLSDYAKSLPFFNHQQLIEDWRKMLAGKLGFDFRFWRWVNVIHWCQLHDFQFERMA